MAAMMMSMFGNRNADVTGLKALKCPEEGGGKKEYDDFMDKIVDHTNVTWTCGDDLATIIRGKGDPTIEPPKKLDPATVLEDWEKAEREAAVQFYGQRVMILRENKKALYSLVIANVTKLMKSKVIATDGYSKADKTKDIIWLMSTLDDIMLGFEKIKSPIMAIDDQMEKIMRHRQKETDSNEDFIKMMMREIKVFEKHGNTFLWGVSQEEELNDSMEKTKKKLLDKGMTEMTEEEEKEERNVRKKQIKEKIAAVAILKRADKKRFGNLLIKLQNDYLLGNDDYPTSVAETLKILDNYKTEWSGNRPPGRNPNGPSPRPQAMSFLQTGGEQVKFLKGTNNSFHPRITCHLCGIKGHFKNHCPVATNEDGDGVADTNQESNEAAVQEVSRTVDGFVMNQVDGPHINPNWILLDSESTNHVFRNGKLLTNVRETTDGEVLRMHSNGGYLDTRQKGDFGSIDVWYNQNSLANILSLALVSDKYRVTMDTDIENAFNVHISEGHVLKFKRELEDLYALDVTSIDLSKLKSAFSFLNTVEQNKKMFNTRDVRKADEASWLNRRTNHMAKDKFVRIVQNNLIRNCPVTVGDVRRAHAIYGPPLPPIKGRTKYEESPRVKETMILQLPIELYEDLKHVTLCSDFCYVNGVAVFHTISRKIDYRTASFPISRSRQSIVKEFKEVQQKYHSRGFRIVDLHADNEFQKIEREILPVRLHCCGTDDHVPEIERSIQTLKNECRSVCHGMPYKCIPRIMVREIVKQGVEFLNAFGNGKATGEGLTARNIIDNLPHVDYNDLKYEMGEYVQLHITEKITNTMKSRTIGAIVLGPRNIRGRYNFMSLETGAQIDGRVVTSLPITNEVIQRVEQLGSEQQQPMSQSKMLLFEWRPGLPINNDDMYADASDTQRMVILPEPIEMQDAAPTPFNTMSEQGAVENGVPPMRLNGEEPTIKNQGANKNQGADETGNEGNENQGAGVTEISEENDEDEIMIEIEMDNEDKEVEENDDEKKECELEKEDDESIEIENRRNEEKQRRSSHWNVDTENFGRGKRGNRKNYIFLNQKKKKGQRNYSFLSTTKIENVKHGMMFLQKEFVELTHGEKRKYFQTAKREMDLTGRTNLMERFTTGLVFAQMSAKKGLEIYGEEAERKLIAEFAQLMEYDVFDGMNADELTEQQKKEAGNMINLIEEKLNRGHTKEKPVIRSRSVFNGKVQRGIYTKEETTSPTVSLDAFTITCIIDAIEGRKKAVTDIKGAYLNAKMKDLVIMKITGPEVDIFCKLDPNLEKSVTIEKGKKVLYVRLKKALYGCVQSALLWYELYSTTLKDMGFTLNPYDLCVANADIDGSQCTICWYVDDNKISHMKDEVIDSIIEKIESKFGKMSQTRGDEHDFLGMNIKYKDGKVVISMKKHIQKAIDEFQEPITREAATPAKSYLFDIRDESPKLNESKADNFHSVVASLLFVSRRCRLDIQTAIGFLTTRVSEPDEDDWSKLRRVLQYLNGTLDLTLTLGGDKISIMKAWVDVSYGVHSDCRSHTGGCISFGWGVVLTKCQKQKLNVKSSTEGEIVGVSDYLPNMIWGRMFIEAQGYPMEELILYQDNQSAIKIEKNGKKSSGQKTKHMDNRYFWIKDRLESEKIKVVYCPTLQMLADFFTKPLQGTLFKKFRDVVLGYVHIDTLLLTTEEDSVQERVEKNDNSEDCVSPESCPSIVPTPRSYADVVKGKEKETE